MPNLNGSVSAHIAGCAWPPKEHVARLIVSHRRTEHADEQQKPKLVHPEPPKTETAIPEGFDAAAYFKEAMKLRKPLQPVIRKAAVLAEVRVMRPDKDTWFQCNPAPEASMDAYVLRDAEKRFYYVANSMVADPVIYPRLKPVLLIEAAVWPPTVPYIIPIFIPIRIARSPLTPQLGWRSNKRVPEFGPKCAGEPARMTLLKPRTTLIRDVLRQADVGASERRIQGLLRRLRGALLC